MTTVTLGHSPPLVPAPVDRVDVAGLHVGERAEAALQLGPHFGGKRARIVAPARQRLAAQFRLAGRGG